MNSYAVKAMIRVTFAVALTLTAVAQAHASPILIFLGGGARGINNAGQVVGGVALPTPSGALAGTGFVWTSALGFSTFIVPGARHTAPYGINDVGQIVGSADSSAFVRESDGSFLTLGLPGIFAVAYGINDAGVIVGTFYDSIRHHGFIRDPTGGVTVLDGLSNFWLFGINDLGDTVGMDDGAFLNRGFLRDASGGYTVISVPGSSDTVPSGINNTGQIVGSYRFGSDYYPFLRESDGTYIKLNIAGAIAAYGLNDGGQIVGTYDSGSFLVSPPYPPSPAPVPEPGTLILLGTGSAVGVWRFRRRSV